MGIISSLLKRLYTILLSKIRGDVSPVLLAVYFGCLSGLVLVLTLVFGESIPPSSFQPDAVLEFLKE